MSDMQTLRLLIIRMLALTFAATFVGGGVTSVAHAAAPICSELFSEPVKTLSQSETKFSFLPEYVRLVRRSEKQYFADYVYTIQGTPRLKSSELAMDSANVIDANLNSGRELLNAILNGRKGDSPSGTFVFIDVNNLGWVNKNFADKEKAGDLYLAKTIEAIQKVIANDGLVFRLGGDEFGIIIETQNPEAVQKIMQRLQAEIHALAHEVFLRETRQRVLQFREIYQQRKNGQISEAEYQAAYLQFKTYTSYSQEGVSMGAAYLDGSQAEAIQHRAEKMATEMKIKIKQAFNLDTSKYTGGVNLSNPENRISTAFRPEVPQIMSVQEYGQTYAAAVKPDSVKPKKTTAWFSLAVPVKTERAQQVARFGQVGIAKYKNDISAEEYRLERYNLLEQITETRPIETNNNTGFMDARSQGARVVINHFLERVDKPGQTGATMLISLLNLGKLNYFHKKTATGDRALGLAAQAITKELSGNHVTFKSNGSDFLILSAGLSKEEAAAYKKNLEEKLNSNPLLDEIFLKEIEYIRQTESDPQTREKRVEEVRKLMSKKFQVQ